MLVSRDEQSCLVVSYRDIKNCIESAFGYVHFSLPLGIIWVDLFVTNLATCREGADRGILI